MKNDLLKRGRDDMCPVLTPLLPTKCLLIWLGTLVNFIPPLQFLSVQGTMGAGAGVRAGPQSERSGQLNLIEAVCYPRDASPANTGLHATSTTNQYPSVILSTDKVHIKLGKSLN